LGKKKKQKSTKKMKQNTKKPFTARKVSVKEKRFLSILPFIVILILAFVYFSPFLSGKKMMYGSDWLLGGYAQREWSANYILEYKELPMWYPYIFGGCPTIATFFGDLLSPHTFLYLFFPVHTVRTYLFILYIFLAGIGLYLFLQEMKLGIFPSTLGAICYMFSGSMISTTYAGHLGRLISVALLPLMLLFIFKGVKRKRFFYFIFFAGITALSFLAGHFQMTYYAVGFSIFFFIFLIVGERKSLQKKGILKIVSFCIIGFLVLGMFVSISFLPVYTNLSSGARGETKGYEYTTSWSMPTAELIDLFVPEFSGIKEHYWGENYFKLHSEYFGILPLLFLLIGFLFCFKDRNVKFFFFIGLAALFLALGKNTPIFRIAYYILPGIKKFRAPALIFYILTFSTIIVGAFGMKKLLERKDCKRILITLLCFIGCYLIFSFVTVVGKEGIITFVKSHFSYLHFAQGDAKTKAFIENYPLFIKGVGRSLVIVIVSSILITLFLLKRLKVHFLFTGLLVILLIDQWFIGKKYLLPNPPPSEYYAKDEVVSFLKKDKGLYRVFPLQYQRSNDGILILHNIQSLGGYHPNPLRRYQELLGAGESVMFRPVNLIQHSGFINLLNGKYIVGMPLPSDTMRYDKRARAAIKEMGNYYSKFHLLHKRQYAIYENKDCLPRGFFVENYRVFKDKNSLLKFMETDGFNPLETVLLEEKPDIPKPDTLVGGSIVSIEDYNANRISLKVDAKTKGFLVLSENYFPRWHCYVDGERTKVYIADYTLRAIPVKEGKHSVLFVYEDASYNLGKTFSIIGFVILLFSFIFQFFQRKNQPQKNTEKNGK